MIPQLHDHIRHAHKGKLLLGSSSLIPSSPLSNPLLALATLNEVTPPTNAPEVAAAAVRLNPNPTAPIDCRVATVPPAVSAVEMTIDEYRYLTRSAVQTFQALR